MYENIELAYNDRLSYNLCLYIKLNHYFKIIFYNNQFLKPFEAVFSLSVCILLDQSNAYFDQVKY